MSDQKDKVSAVDAQYYVAEFGRNVCGTIMGVDLACVLTVLGASITGTLATRAVFFFLGSLALLAPHVFISYANAWHKQSVSQVMKWLPVFGLILCALGICHLVEGYVQGAGWFLAVFGILNFYVFVQSADRAKANRGTSSATK